MWHSLPIYEVEKRLKTDIEKGLSEKEAEKRLKEFGKNELEEGKKLSIFTRFINQFKDFMIIVLLFAATLSFVISYIEKSNEYIDSIIIMSIVTFNAIIGVIQESKAEKSLEALKKLSSPTSNVKRNNKYLNIPSSQLVVGDIVYLETGNIIPADCRLIKTNNFKVEESSLTGEAISVTKNSSVLLNKEISLGDTINMAFASTIVTSGNAIGIVTETAMNTKVGKIAKMIISDEGKQTPLQKKLSDVGKKLGIICLIICILIFIVGLLKNISIMEIFMTSVGLAVAAIPEGLPAIVTILLSIGVTKMAKKNAIIRKLPAVETLGSSSIICSDKTGTLTQNKMQVIQLVDFEGKELQKGATFDLTCKLGAMCNDSIIQKEGKKYKINGEATENALIEFAIKHDFYKDKLYLDSKRINEIPFESERKMMSTIHELKDGGFRVITKGAPDVLINRCDKVLKNGRICSISKADIEIITKTNENMASNALRVLAIAYNDISKLPNNIDSQNIEKNLIFVSLVGMIDPPRPGVKEAIMVCKKAGIKVAMITGDHVLTANAIAKNLGIICNASSLSITGSQIDKLSDKAFEKNILKYSVFARVSPEHKVKIVKAFQKTGAVVAMTGDGVNDAPALKKADIGISMGLNGTDVAKNASDMVLTDDNFVTIVEAVKEGRHIYDNIKKAVHFLLATNIGEIIAIFIGLILGFDTPLLAIHLLWINLVTDSLPAIALGMEKEDKYIMYKKPKSKKKGLFSDGLWKKISIEGVTIGVLTLLSFNLGTSLYGIKVGRTMAFLTLGLSELVHSINVRSDKSIFEIGLFSNKYLNLALLIGGALQILVVIIPPIANILDVVPLTSRQWIYTGSLSILPIILIESIKKLKEIIFGKTIYTVLQNEVAK